VKVGQLLEVLKTAERAYAAARDRVAVEALRELAKLFEGYHSKTVTVFVTQAINARRELATEPEQSNSASAANSLGDLCPILQNLGELFDAAGVKGPKNDFENIVKLVEGANSNSVESFVSETRGLLAQPRKKTGSTGSKRKVTRPLDEAAVETYSGRLLDARNDRQLFDAALGQLKASRALKLPELAAVAHRYTGYSTNYKKAAAIFEDIENVFIERARFENKIRS
jgi:hypothetical protein